MARDYQVKKAPLRTATAIAVPKAGDKTPPQVIELTEEEQKALSDYIAAKRKEKRAKNLVLALVERHGKLAYKDCTFSPRQAVRYEYDQELQAEIDAVDEKKKAARDAGAYDAIPGTISIDFADKKAKPKKKGGQG